MRDEPDLSDYNPADNLAAAETMPERWYLEPEFLAYDLGRFSLLRENGPHHFQSLVHEFLARG